MGFDSTKLAVGAGEVLWAPRGARNTVTCKAATANTVTVLTIVAATEGLKIRVGDILLPAGTTPLNTVAEATTSPRITSITQSGADLLVTVAPAFGVAPANGAVLPILFHDLGATKGDIEFGVETMEEDIEVDQSLDVIGQFLTGRKVSLTAPLAEQTVQQFAMAAGLVAPATQSGLSLDVGATLPASTQENRFLTLFPAPAGRKRWILMHRGSTSGKGSLKASKKELGVTELNVVAMPDSGLASGLNVFQLLDV
jgi:hypothetical protein